MFVWAWVRVVQRLCHHGGGSLLLLLPRHLLHWQACQPHRSFQRSVVRVAFHVCKGDGELFARCTVAAPTLTHECDILRFEMERNDDIYYTPTTRTKDNGQ